MRLKKYERDAAQGYSFGVFPTLELLRHQPSAVREVLLNSAGERNSGVTQLREACAAAHIPLTSDDKLIARIAPKENTYAVGVFQKYTTALRARANHIVLVNPTDMGNLGTIIRTMLGFGFADLALIRPAADIFDPRVVRSSMGALFQMRFAYFDSFAAYRASNRGRCYPFMTDGRVPLHEARFEPPYALIFGSESSGLPDSFRSEGVSVSIPHAAAIDSLNLAVALGIALYHAADSQSPPTA
jgi:TrmH family RNA methyltransferase